MARTPAQRGRIGNWLVESRMARGWETQEKARAEIQRLTGWRIPQSVYAEWESGRRLPADGNLARLQEFYGSTSALEATQSGDSVAALTRAIEAQTAALVSAIQHRDSVIEALLSELATYRRQTVERQTVERSLLESLPEALAIALGATPSGVPASERPVMPPREAAAGR